MCLGLVLVVVVVAAVAADAAVIEENEAFLFRQSRDLVFGLGNLDLRCRGCCR